MLVAFFDIFVGKRPFSIPQSNNLIPYKPYLNQWLSRDPFPGYGKLPQSQNGYSYVHGNSVNYTDPSGLCIDPNTGEVRMGEYPSGTSGRCSDSSSRPFSSVSWGSRNSLFNFLVLPGQPGSDIVAYLLVNYQDMPWGKYASNSAPKHPTLVPVRHTVNLTNENPNCKGSLQAAKDFYTSGSFYAWEVNARNIIVEMKGSIKDQTNWALQDAIGIAYIPYNRVAFNNLPREERYPVNGGTYFPYQGRNNALGMLLQGDGQVAVSSTEKNAYTAGIDPGEDYKDVYHFSLVVAYGVDRRYLMDTSYGGNEYFHHEGCTVGHEYAFFKNQQFEFYGQRDRQFTTEELQAQGGWPGWASDPGWYYDNWKTGFPPLGCNIPRK